MGYQWEHWAWLGAFLWISPQDTYAQKAFSLGKGQKEGEDASWNPAWLRCAPHQGQIWRCLARKKKKVQKTGLHKQPKLPLVDATLSELTCVLLQMYPAVSTLCFFHMHFASNDPPPFYFLTILISAEFFKEDENQSPFFCLSPPESAPNSSFKTCSADGIPYKRLSFALSTLLTAEGARDPSRNGGAFLGGCQ